MKIYLTRDGRDIPFKQFTFPDGQRHFELLDPRVMDTEVTVETAIRSAEELFDLLLVKDVLDSIYCRCELNIRYLMGARMDRKINPQQPWTLFVVANIIYDMGWKKIRILDPHSEVAVGMLDAEAVYPFEVVNQILANYPSATSVIVSPDKGATERVRRLVGDKWHRPPIIQGRKCRDSQTGKLSGFGLEEGTWEVKGKTCLILDDICDGGGTFSGLAKVLLEAGAAAVDLFVTHGIFSKGLPLEGIRRVYTTDSYRSRYQLEDLCSFDALVCDTVKVFPISMSKGGINPSVELDRASV